MGRTKKNETKVLSEDPKKTYKKLHTVHGKYLDILTYTTLTDDQKIMMDRVEKNIEKLYEKYGKEYFKDVVKSRDWLYK